MQHLINPQNIIRIFQMLGWGIEKKDDKAYVIISSPRNNDIWLVLPTSTNDTGYSLQQDKAVRLVLYALGVEENKMNYLEILSQLEGLNYKILNRVQTVEKDSQEVIPFEIAQQLPKKTIDAFRTFQRIRTNGRIKLPVESFGMGHTQHGSFIIPVTVSVLEEVNTFSNVPNMYSTWIMEYLEKVDIIVKTHESDARKFVDKMISNEIDSKIIKDYLGAQDSIAKLSERYRDKVTFLSVGTVGNMILDRDLTYKNKEREVQLEEIEPIEPAFIELLERTEVELGNENIIETETTILAEVDSIDINGTAKFTVFSIGEEEIKKPFKATTSELPKQQLDLLANAFQSRDMVTIKGDIKKQRKKMGKVLVAGLNTDTKKIENPTLFDAQ